MKNIIRKHKNTATSVVSLVVVLVLAYQWLIEKAMTFTEFTGSLGAVAVVASTIVGFIAPDAKDHVFKKKKTNENTKNSLDCACGGNCQCVQQKTDQ